MLKSLKFPILLVVYAVMHDARALLLALLLAIAAPLWVRATLVVFFQRCNQSSCASTLALWAVTTSSLRAAA